MSVAIPAAGMLISAEDLLSRRKLAEALDCYYCAEEEGADRERCAAGRWMIHMLRGDFSAAWAESDAIRKLGKRDPNCLWSGEPLEDRRVIVRCLHGFGDAVQFFRYALQLNAAANKVVWQVPPEMVDVARCFSGVEQVITWGQERSAFPDWDVQIECMELASIFQTRLEELPISTRYLRLPSSVAESITEQMGQSGKLRIGVVWAAGEWNPCRSIPLELFGRLFQVSDCEFWNLQGGAERHFGGAFLHDIEACNGGIVQLAGVIQQLDLVIAVDTLAAHLAGALGVPAWVLLQYAADWRWMVGRVDSPWYPSLRLFRQRAPGDWGSVLYEVERALLEWIGCDAERIAA